MDEDKINDEMSGTVRLDVKELLENDWYNGMYTWKNIYGSPLGQNSSDAKTEMNTNPETASAWKGRVLIQTLVEPCEKPIHIVRPIEQDAVDEA